MGRLLQKMGRTSCEHSSCVHSRVLDSGFRGSKIQGSGCTMWVVQVQDAGVGWLVSQSGASSGCLARLQHSSHQLTTNPTRGLKGRDLSTLTRLTFCECVVCRGCAAKAAATNQHVCDMLCCSTIPHETAAIPSILPTPMKAEEGLRKGEYL